MPGESSDRKLGKKRSLSRFLTKSGRDLRGAFRRQEKQSKEDGMDFADSFPQEGLMSLGEMRLKQIESLKKQEEALRQDGKIREAELVKSERLAIEKKILEGAAGPSAYVPVSRK